MINTDKWVRLCERIRLQPDHFKTNEEMLERARYFGEKVTMRQIVAARAEWDAYIARPVDDSRVWLRIRL
jgi:hypothetical protein